MSKNLIASIGVFLGSIDRIFFPLNALLIANFYNRLKFKEFFNIRLFDTRWTIVFLVTPLMLFNFMILGENNISLQKLVSNPFIFLGTFFIAFHLDSRFFKAILFLILFECTVGFTGWTMGIKSFIYNVGAGGGDLFYNSSSWGLSSNSSLYAAKVLVGWIVFFKFFDSFSEKIRWFILFILVLGLISVFNRTLWITILFFSILLLTTKFKFRFKISNLRIYFNKKIAFVWFTAILAALLFVSNLDVVLYQFQRGVSIESLELDNLELSGRQVAWYEYIDYIQQNLYFGNNSHQLYIEINGRLFHAHNSYLQTLATHGLVISILLFLVLFLSTFSRNSIFILPLIIYSLSQNAIFTNFSLIDLLLWWLILNKN